MAQVWRVECGNPVMESEMFRRLSPIQKLDNRTAPTAVMHGANDTNVPVVEAEEIVTSLKQRTLSVDYLLFPDGGHSIGKTANRARATVEVVRWFMKHLVKL